MTKKRLIGKEGGEILQEIAENLADITKRVNKLLEQLEQTENLDEYDHLMNDLHRYQAMEQKYTTLRKNTRNAIKRGMRKGM